MMAKGYEQGFGYLRGVAIDQHLLVRRRQDDLVEVIDKKPELLGLGIDEPTAIVVQGDRFEVIGRSVVGIYDGKDHDGKSYYFLAPGDQFDLRVAQARGGRAETIASVPSRRPRSRLIPRKPRSPRSTRTSRRTPIRRGRWRGRSGNGPRSAIRRNGRRRCWPTPWKPAASRSSAASRGSRRRSSPRSARASR